jgi:hypothetical protein
MVDLEDFWIKDPLNKSIISVNFKKVLSLSDEDFANYYLQLMDTYNLFWKERNQVLCGHCHEELSGPRDLVRYFGLNLHKICFPEYFKSYPPQDKTLQKYFQRVVKMVSSNSQLTKSL